MRIAKFIVGFGVLLACWVPAVAGIGSVTDEKGLPLEDVSACYVLNGVDMMCVSTNARGLFELPASEVGKVRFNLPGYLPVMLDRVPEDKPVMLKRAAEIWVRLVDPAGETLESGQVYLLFPNGARKGPFPVNAQGVRVRTLEPGEYRVVAQAEGWIQQRSHRVKLVPGVVADARVVLTADGGPVREDD